MNIVTIKVTTQFSDSPGAAFKREGPWSGEAFCEEILLPTFRQNPKAKIEIDFDGVYGCIYAFPYQAVYNLTKALIEDECSQKTNEEWYSIRNRVISDIQNRLIITTKEIPDLIYPVVDAIDDAASDCKTLFTQSVTNDSTATQSTNVQANVIEDVLFITTSVQDEII